MIVKGYHEPVLVAEIPKLLVKIPGVYVDGTLGGGGHSHAILQELLRRDFAEQSLVIGIDQDDNALDAAEKRLSSYSGRLVFVKGNFGDLQKIVQRVCIENQRPPVVAGMLLDLGVSSAQIDSPERGFSYLHQGPLDMRMDPAAEKSAADIINAMSERELANLFYRFGEEPRSRSIARSVVDYRERYGPILRTETFADIIRRREARPDRAIKTLSRIFQAVRIEVNRELDVLARVLEQSTALLSPLGRLAVISYHSLEDRMVKSFFVEQARSDWGPKGVGLREPLRKAGFSIVTRRAIVAGEQELSSNPRARSAKLRVLEKLAAGDTGEPI
ncbi:MAG: 16S rRNA (cytosine(1402)-N(4))-methyltransferase RsmH [Chlorobium sp.]|jgi:16S rRNA (cytosine1402-N4)-methyltransferase|uniref:16S rRNA (cytosine(1402)-N(4))-methyltransferase RsmH n=1 Tax=Chlorobium sp. TaxID=1095 RepID=UPI001D39E075|nr:16S rRNA (cytosine(1402)-N(4))-methyltransferase RsmH [Chlorobium sp.]MBN1279034.1 16S rRNA (cytosine(1402)-N(4))-methyltransferase RsmH [Chlorobiaceae bacterium]MCF8216313.1 16S rRNA (cytosine(1402)-N(4))-methyltransferase RsmH [Chlorobium sp.]MCF8271215.1 16S rRNA (cytosine(1402)-N(4))-methyltransferase RsmH [Chlorobium sp.]MCF8287589.1 16S rRNA (cytosine(1402)-N(4))-methyltransferase RsmH [Chlorobium sp.]MCF8291128.1 16S rRNA (cytosine(1402)-N(4))-methyltransferase RsmH [Chlorobium sp.]